MKTGVNGALRQADRAYAGLRDLIVTLELAPGAALSEDELMSRLSVGRTPLREAVKRLEVETWRWCSRGAAPSSARSI